LLYGELIILEIEGGLVLGGTKRYTLAASVKKKAYKDDKSYMTWTLPDDKHWLICNFPDYHDALVSIGEHGTKEPDDMQDRV